ncbi:MAG: polyphosphate kinase [Ignavibacteriaceae bacterium]
MTGKELLKKYKDQNNFFNRDLSWVEFNRRVMEEALNPELPLLEKVKFISIFFSNLDEFYMIRVSGLKEQIAANILEPTIDGLTPLEQVQKIEKALKPMLDTLYNYWNGTIVPELTKNHIFLLRFQDFNPEEQEKLRDYFQKEIYPILTPLAFDPGRPFPYISNLSLNLAVLIRNPKGDTHFARVKVPSNYPRLLSVDDILNPNKILTTNGDFVAKFIWFGDLIKANLDLLFPGVEVLESHRFRVTRDTDIELQEDEADDLLRVIEENIRQRRFGQVVRMEVEDTMPEYMMDTLMENLRINRVDVHISEGPIGLSDAMSLYKLPLHQLKEKPYYPVLPKRFETDEDIFTIYGLVGLKTHTKMTLVVRKEFDGVKRYVHLATGNYNTTTAKLYTDLGLFTCDNDICADVSDVFNYLTGYSKQKDYRKLFVSPVNMREKMLEKVFREIENVNAGKDGKIIWKMNSLVDPQTISALYEASNAGIKIDLIVRGICCLVPGVKGLSENIKVRSIVGRYLEHSRLFYFYNDGKEEMYLGSADMMQRNLDGRVETLFPVEDENIRNDIMKTLVKASLSDNQKARLLTTDMIYQKVFPLDGEKHVNSQEWLMKRAEKHASQLVKS